MDAYSPDAPRYRRPCETCNGERFPFGYCCTACDGANEYRIERLHRLHKRAARRGVAA